MRAENTEKGLLWGCDVGDAVYFVHEFVERVDAWVDFLSHYCESVVVW